MPEGRRRAAAAGWVLDALRARGDGLDLPMSKLAVHSVFGLRRFAARLEQRWVTVGDFRVPYLVGGQGPPLVLLHGFSDNKDSFVDTARFLTATHRVILPDLVGFGEASQPFDLVYRIARLAGIVGLFADALGMRRFALGGNSLGGAVALDLALAQPDRVEALVLLAPAGISSPVRSLLQDQLDAGHNPFVLKSVDEYEAWLRVVLEVPPRVPAAVQRHLAETFIARADLNRKIMDDLLSGGENLTSQLSSVRVPTLLLWGDRDRLIDVTAGRLVRDAVPDSSLVVLHGIGHCPQYELPQRSAQLIAEFLSRRATW